MGVFLSCEQMWDMPIADARARGLSDDAPSDQRRHIPHFVGNILYGVIGAAFKIAFRYSVINVESLRRFTGGRGCVVVANHTSYLDPVFFFLAARPRQWIRFMGRDTLFEHCGRLLGQLLSRIGAFPVKRDSADRKAIKRASTMLKNGEIVCVYPEGTRRGRGTAVSSLHGGAAFIARMGCVPLLPATVRGAELIKQKGRCLRFPKVEVEFGEPVYLEAFDCFPKNERLDIASWYVMRQSYAMFYEIEPEKVDMASLFPESRDYSELLDGFDAAVYRKGLE